VFLRVLDVSLEDILVDAVCRSNRRDGEVAFAVRGRGCQIGNDQKGITQLYRRQSLLYIYSHVGFLSTHTDIVDKASIPVRLRQGHCSAAWTKKALFSWDKSDEKECILIHYQNLQVTYAMFSTSLDLLFVENDFAQGLICDSVTTVWARN
jgi:hypothetical protein